jgi:glucose/mannose-6-phosphate isomerase
MILDNKTEIAKIDKSNACGVLEAMPEDCETALRNANELKLSYKKPKRVLIAGMGGSAIGGDLARDWLKDRIPAQIEVYRGYELPRYADADTLVILASYSGNTEETIGAYEDAKKKNCMAVVVTSGGDLAKMALKDGVPLVLIAKGFMPRFAISHLFISIAVVLEKTGLIKAREDIDSAITVLKALREELKRDTPAKMNEAKQLAMKIGDRIPTIYGFGPFKAVAKRIKTQFNENAKVPAKWEFFPELTHNEIVGYESELSKLLFPIFIRDKAESNKYSARINIAKEIIQEKCETAEIYARGDTKLAKMLSVMYIGDFASVYMAVLRKTDPTPIKEIERIKNALKGVKD